MNLSQVILSPVFPSWLILLLLFVGLAAVILQYGLIRKRLGRQRALGVSILRLCVLLLLISFAFNPSLIERKERKASGSFAILIDISQSMNEAESAGKNRLDEAKAFLLQEPGFPLNTLAKRFDVRLYSLGESLRPIDAKEVAGLKAQGRRGDLNDALGRLRGKNAFAILLSDGNLKWDEGPAADLPLFVLPVGEPRGYKDILLKSVKASSIAFRGREVSIDIAIKSYGYKGLTLPVVLKEGNKVLTAKNAHLSESPAETTLSLFFTPEKVGQHTFQIFVPTQAGESLVANNTASFSMNVVRDKIRVLMISGNPSINYRYMRAALKNDPSIDLLSFVILRTPTDILNVPLQEQSLIPFPVETLFTKELSNFDLLIFDNLPSHLYISPHYLSSIREFVKGGGGFAMIGGPTLLDGGRYAGTVLEEVLPVRVAGRDLYRRDSPNEVKLSRAGLTHPITRLSQSEAENLSLWKEMPALDGINLLEPRSYKNVLLESADGTSRPILAVGDYRKGRVLVLGTDYSWKWYMGMVGQGKGNWAYLRLTERMVRWLTKDPSLDPVQIEITENTPSPGQELEVKIKVREEGASPDHRSPVSLSVYNPDGVKIGSQLKSSGQPGEYIGSFLPEKEGTYRVKVETPVGFAEESIIVPGPLGDLDASPDHDKLKRIAASTGGKILLKADDLLKEIEAKDAKSQSRIIEERHVPLWGTAYILVFILFLLGTEWYLRRKWGMV
ncbi:MAG TPA: glutamine amidotransferase [Thermodesulfobacteriota bacterium]|nr:glutamine amidotransferase [Thermodesulfobacteriota bacterium]